MDTIRNTLSNIYSYLEDLLIIKEYIINPEDDLITKTEMFILRYRRILGIILLIILLYIMFFCNIGINGINGINKTILQRGGSANTAGTTPATPDIPTPATPATSATPATDIVGKGKKSKIMSSLKKEGSQIKKAAKGSIIAKKASKLRSSMKSSGFSKKTEEMKQAGFSKTEIAGRGAYSAGATVGNKFKEFSGWLYEILFGIAIAIAICMVILPSLSFFIVGLICYFLLKRKVSSLKSA